MELCEVARTSEWDLLLLFGSQARQTATPESDHDFAILPGKGSRDIDPLCRALGTHNVDVAWLDEASWLLWQEVARDAVALFQSRPQQFADFQLEARLRGWDSDIWRTRNRRFVQRVLEEDQQLNRDLIERKLALLAQYVAELKPILKLPRERFLADPMVHHAAERLVELLVESSAAVNTEVSQSVGGISPSDYYSSFFSLASTGWIETGLAEKLGQWARLRNTLVHRYESVGLEQLYVELQTSLPTWLAYVGAIQQKLAERQAPSSE